MKKKRFKKILDKEFENENTQYNLGKVASITSSIAPDIQDK